jgi:hypothetical protein
MPLAYNEFVCPNCKTSQLPPIKPIGLVDQLTSFFHFGRLVEKDTGSLPMKIPILALTFDSHSEYTFVDITDGKTHMSLKRTSDMKLQWRVDQGLISRTAVWDLDESPKNPEAFFVIAWNPDQVKIISPSLRDGLWEASSNGTMRKLE